MKNKAIIIPILLILLLTPFTPWLDIHVSRLFYTPDTTDVDHFVSNNFLDFMYNYGIIPAWILGIGSSLLLMASYLNASLKKYRNPALVLVLTLLIGSGFISHLIFKDHWGRPRPKQTLEFGGTQPFRPYYEPNFFNQTEPSKSFPCGHCTMGFYFFALALVGKRMKKPWLTYTGYSLAILLGVALSVTRIMQGGHFLSDTIFGGLIMYLTARGMDWLVYSSDEEYARETVS